MKSQRNTTSFGKMLIIFLTTGMSLTFMSFTRTEPALDTYKIVSSKIVMEGTGKISDWKMQVDSSKFDGSFITEGDQLEDIKGFHFSFALANCNSSNPLVEETIKSAILSKNCNEIIFNQKSLMILPIMKMIHLIGEMKIGKDSYSVSMQMQYLLNEDGSIIVSGKQHVALSEFGIRLANVKLTDANEEITINISLKLAKQQPLLAKVK